MGCGCKGGGPRSFVAPSQVRGAYRALNIDGGYSLAQSVSSTATVPQRVVTYRETPQVVTTDMAVPAVPTAAQSIGAEPLDHNARINASLDRFGRAKTVFYY